MGLRIVDRRTPVRADITDAERLAGLEVAASDWLAARGGVQTVGKAEFLANFGKVKARLASPDSVVEMATRIRDCLRRPNRDGATPHNQVDIATLLELL